MKCPNCENEKIWSTGSPSMFSCDDCGLNWTHESVQIMAQNTILARLESKLDAIMKELTE